VTNNKKNKTTTDRNKSFRQALIERAVNAPSFSIHYRYYSDIDSLNDPGPLKQILGLDDDFFSDRETKVLAILENEAEGYGGTRYSQFKWEVFAFLSVQDIFDAPLARGNDLLSLFHQWYFYYESKYRLIETILCGINGFMGAMGSLLRLFLEFNLLQHFFLRNINNTSSFQVLEDYYTKGVNPNWNTIINGAMSTNSFTKPIKKRIHSHLQGLSENCSHPYHPTFTQTRSGSVIPEPTLERIFSYTWVTLVLEPVIWLYCVNFPMLFHGVNIERKFGFNGPVGIFVDEQVTKIIKKCFNQDDFEAFYEFSKRQQKVISLLAWYEERQTLSEDEIMQTWNVKQDGTINNIVKGHVIQTAKMRGLREALAFKLLQEPEALFSGQEEEIFDRLSSYDWWRTLHNRTKKNSKNNPYPA
jgi:hypothetical protein